MRVFNVSLHKTGTTRFYHFCRSNDLSAVHWAGREFDESSSDCVDDLDCEKLWLRYLSKFSGIQAHSDLPCPSIFRQAAREFPNARFVLMVRKPSDWIKSVREHTKNRTLDNLEKIMYWKILGDKRDRLSDYSDQELEFGLVKFISDVSASMHEMRVPFFRIFNLDGPNVGSELAGFLALPSAQFTNTNKKNLQQNSHPPMIPDNQNAGAREEMAHSQPASTRVVAITRVLNEADIIESFIRHNRSFVDHHILLDNGSSDGTVEILNGLKEEGFPITVFKNISVTFNESDFLTSMYKKAYEEYGADWVLCLDADEFVDDRKSAGGLTKLLREKTHVDIITVQLINYIATSSDNRDEIVVPKRIIRRRAETGVFKVFINAKSLGSDICITHGSHAVFSGGKKIVNTTEKNIVLAHYPERSPFQAIAKFVRGWSKVLSTSELEIKKGTAKHYKPLYEYLLNDPEKILRNKKFMTFKDEHIVVGEDPIDYRGGDLKYTTKNDEEMRCIRCILGFYDSLAAQHRAILDNIPEARAFVRKFEGEVDKLF